MNKKKVRLDYTDHFDFYLLGISSFEKDYRLIWNMNNALGFQFSRTANHQAYSKKEDTEQGFACYLYKDEDSYLQYRFVANKGEEGYLIDELKNIDFFLLIQGDDGIPDISDIRHKVSSIENVQAVFVIDPGNLKNRQRLIDG